MLEIIFEKEQKKIIFENLKQIIVYIGLKIYLLCGHFYFGNYITCGT